MATMSTCTLEEALGIVEETLPYALKEQQISCIKSICRGQNVFALLPTGYGKSDILALPPLVMDKVYILYAAQFAGGGGGGRIWEGRSGTIGVKEMWEVGCWGKGWGSGTFHLMWDWLFLFK